MDSAGKRITKPPVRLIDQVLQPEILTLSGSSMASNVSTSITTGSTDTPTVSSGQSAPRATTSEETIQKMFAQLLASQRSNDAGIRAMREDMNTRWDQCLERWQAVDIRTTKLEDDQARFEQQKVKMNEIIQHNTSRITLLENEVVNIRSDLGQFILKSSQKPPTNDTTQLPTHASSLIGAPPDMSQGFRAFNGNTMPTSSTMNPVANYTILNSTGQGQSSFFGSQERLNDAVSEFSGRTRSIHPEHFICQLDTYFENVPMSVDQQVISAQRRLSGDARLWYDSLIPTPTSYNDFRILFRQRFWSAATQRKTRNEVFRPFQYTRYDGLATHAMQWIAGAKYLSPPIDPIDLVSTIIQHYPIPLSMALRGRGPRDTNELLSVLTEFEESTSFCEQRHDEHQPHHTNNPPNPQNERRTQENRQGYRGGYNRGHQQRNPPTAPVAAPIHQLNVSGNDQAPRQ